MNSKILCGSRISFKKVVAIVIAVLVICAVFIILALLPFNRLDFAYILTRQTGNTASVQMRISRNLSVMSPPVRLGKAYFSALELTCVDSHGNQVPITDEGEYLTVEFKGEFVDLVYNVTMPQYFNGQSSLVAASGEQFLLLPYFSYEQGEHMNISKQIGSITMTARISEDGDCILPFVPNEGQAEACVNRPEWKDIYDLQKSCYAIGDIERIESSDGMTDIQLYTLRGGQPDDMATLIMNSVADYYNSLFKSPPTNFSLLLLPQTETEFDAAIGGRSAAITIPMQEREQLSSFAHGLFTAYYDNQIRADSLHYPPNLWLYKGLATYYEVMAMDYLPDNVRMTLNLSAKDRFGEFYRRYLYMWMREPSVYRITPAEERTAMDAQLQFYYYTEAPLVIRHMEMTVSKNGTDAVLNELLDESEKKTFDMAEFMNNLLGIEQEEIYNYLAAKTTMPYPGNMTAQENPAQIVEEIDSYDRLLCTWMQADFPQYLYERITIMDMDVIAEECIRLNVRFASDNDEILVSNFSPTLYLLLKQYALRAKICGYDDLTDSKLRFRLLYESENVNKWETYLGTLTKGD